MIAGCFALPSSYDPLNFGAGRNMDAREFQEIGHQVVDLLADYLDHIEEKPVFPRIDPQALRNLFDEPLPESPASADAVLAEIQTKLLPYCTHVGHPGYMGLITPSPNPIGVIGGLHLLGAQSERRRVLHWPRRCCDGAPHHPLAYRSGRLWPGTPAATSPAAA